MEAVRGRKLCLSALAIAGLTLAGCEAKSHENLPRPPVVPVISVSVSEKSVLVAPRAVGLPGENAINLTQNAGAPRSEADPDVPLVANVRFSNLTSRDSQLIIEGPVDRDIRMPANSPGSFTIGLKNGIYRLSSPISEDSRRLTVGPSRPSSASDLLTP